MIEFTDAAASYMVSMATNPHGFVLNVRMVAGPSYVALHRADCRFTSSARDDRAYTGRGYRKVVANDLNELRGYARSLGRWDGSFSGICGHCAPVAEAKVPHGS